MLSGEAANTNFLVSGLTESGLEPRIYHTRGKHVNHYTSDEVKVGMMVRVMVFNNTVNNISAISWRSLLLVKESKAKYPEKTTNLPKSLTNLITQCCIEYTSPSVGFELTM